MNDKKIRARIIKRIKELKKIKDTCCARVSKGRYNFVIGELQFLLEE